MNPLAEPNTEWDDERFQDAVLSGVSRTFALTIPQLPAPLRRTVTNAYLLCRIADTIEDDPGVAPPDKERFHQWFIDLLNGRDDARAFARSLGQELSGASSPQEMELVRHADRVLRVTRRLDDATQAIFRRRVAVMCRGMPAFQRHPRCDGLPNLPALDQYCYYVAGVVGQMLTELFCNYSPRIARSRTELLELSASFGQGLQMTNILKDIWEDRVRGTCWLPRDIFAAHGYDLARLEPGRDHTAFTAALNDLLGVAHGHLRNALSYTLLIPAHETGIRRFCLWSLVLAVLTLQRIRANPGFDTGRQVKVSRRTVRNTVRVTSAVCRSDALTRALFAWSARGLPLTQEVSTYQGFERAAYPTQ
ncbi:MAG: phytoene/squalene synthase family protein [Gammaproteobacteria bacterium]|nr:phytoene/squalene synthase family protein [Gammaproteobacteria bacterium]